MNATELKTTIGKFLKLKSIGCKSPTVLFAYSSDVQGSEFARYYKNEDNNKFYTEPSINVLCVSGKGYYYKSVAEHYVKDYFSNKEWLSLLGAALDIDVESIFHEYRSVMSDEQELARMNRAEFASAIESRVRLNSWANSMEGKDVVLNGIKFNELRFKIHMWVGVENPQDESNDIELCFLSGVSNTLSKGSFGSYLLSGKELNYKVVAICYEDMWGNLSSQDYDENGLGYLVDKFSFSYSCVGDSHKMTFHTEKQ